MPAKKRQHEPRDNGDTWDQGSRKPNVEEDSGDDRGNQMRNNDGRGASDGELNLERELETLTGEFPPGSAMVASTSTDGG